MKRITVLLLGLSLIALVFAPALAEGADGQALYDKKCGMCHGKDGVAKKMGEGSANLNDPEWQKANSVEAIIKVTTEGIADSKMPGYADKLSADEIKAISEYIKTLK